MALQIDVVTNTLRAQRDLNNITKSVENIEKTTSRASRAFKSLALAITGAFAGAAGFRGLSQASDSITKLENRIALYTDTAKEAKAVQDELFDISRRALGSVQSAGDTYAKLAESLKGVAEQDEILTAVESIQLAAKISGASADDASNAIRQLGQGFAGGVLRAEEFNSVIEGTPRLAYALADGLGIARRELRSVMLEGELTTELMLEALLNQFETLSAEASRMAATIDQAWLMLSDGSRRFFGEFAKGIGFSDVVTNAILNLADTLRYSSEAAFAFGRSIRNNMVFLTSMALVLTSQLIPALDGLRAKVVDSIKGLWSGLSDGLKENVASVGTILGGFGTTVSDFFSDIWKTISAPVGGVFEAIFGDMTAQALAGLEKVVGIFNGFKEKIMDIFWSLWDWLVGNSIWPDDIIGGIIKYAAGLWDGVKGHFETFYNGIKGVFERVKKFVNKLLFGELVDPISGDSRGGLMNLLKPWLTPFENFYARLKVILGDVKKLVRRVLFGELVDPVSGDSGRGLVDFFKPWVESARDALNKVFTTIRSFFLTIYNKVKPFFANLGQKIWSFLPESFTLAVENIFKRAPEVTRELNPFSATEGFLGPDAQESILDRIKRFMGSVKEAVLSVDLRDIRDQFANLFVPDFTKIGAAILGGILFLRSQLLRSKASMIATGAAVMAIFNTPMAPALGAGVGNLLGSITSRLAPGGQRGGSLFFMGFVEGLLETNQALGEAFLERNGLSPETAERYGALVAVGFLAGFGIIRSIIAGALPFAANAALSISGITALRESNELLKKDDKKRLAKEMNNKKDPAAAALARRGVRAGAIGEMMRGPGALIGGLYGFGLGQDIAERFFPENDIAAAIVSLGTSVVIAQAVGSAFALIGRIFGSVAIIPITDAIRAVFARIGVALAALWTSVLKPFIVSAATWLFAQLGVALRSLPFRLLGIAGLFGFVGSYILEALIQENMNLGERIGRVLFGLLAIGFLTVLAALAIGASLPVALAVAVGAMLLAVFWSEDAQKALKEAFDKTVEWLTNAWDASAAWVSDLKAKITQGFRSVFGPDGFIVNMKNDLLNLGTEMAKSIWDGIKNFFRDNTLAIDVSNAIPIGQMTGELVPQDQFNPQKKADGGFISGPGGPRSDSIPAMLSNGEYVINAASTRKFLPLLHQINSGTYGKFADGGLAGVMQQYNPKDVTSVADWFDNGAENSSALNQKYGINDSEKSIFYAMLQNNAQSVLDKYEWLAEYWSAQVFKKFSLDDITDIGGSFFRWDASNLRVQLKPLSGPFDTLDEQLAVGLHEYGHLVDFSRQALANKLANLDDQGRVNANGKPLYKPEAYHVPAGFNAANILKFETDASKFAMSFSDTNGWNQLPGFLDMLTAMLGTYVNQAIVLSQPSMFGALLGQRGQPYDPDQMNYAVDFMKQSSRSTEELFNDPLSVLGSQFQDRRYKANVTGIRGYAKGGLVQFAGTGMKFTDIISSLSGLSADTQRAGWMSTMMFASSDRLNLLSDQFSDYMSDKFNSETVGGRVSNLFANKADPEVYEAFAGAGPGVLEALILGLGLSQLPGVGTVLGGIVTLDEVMVKPLQGMSRALRQLGHYDNLHEYLSNGLSWFEGAYTVSDLRRYLLSGPAEMLRYVTGPLSDKFISWFQSNNGVSLPMDMRQDPRLRAATGGYISGPGGPTEDKIPAMLSNGEFVVNAASTKKFHPVLRAINNGTYGAFRAGRDPYGSTPGSVTPFEELSLIEKMTRILSDSGSFENKSNRLWDVMMGRTPSGPGSATAGTKPATTTDGEGTGGGGGGGASSRERRMTDLEKAIAAVDQRYEDYEITLIEHAKEVARVTREYKNSSEGIALASLEISRELTDGLRENFRSSLTNLLSGETGIKGFIDSLLDNFTMSILQSFSSAFTDSLFDGLGLDEIFSNLFNNVFTSIRTSATDSMGKMDLGSFFSGIFSWIGGLFGGGVKAASGGLISGPGTGTSDSILARLSDGEYVINARSTKAFLPLLEEINGYSSGGLVGTSVTPGNIKEQSLGSRQEFNITITGDISDQTRKEIVKMLPQISKGVNNYNRENIYGS